MPVFDNFVFFLAKPNQNSSSSMMMAYITETLHQNIIENSNEYWFTHRKHDRFEWDNQQMALESGFYAPLLNDTPIGSDTFGSKATAVAFNPQENSSFTTSRCAPSVADNVLTNFSSIRGTTVQAARRILSDCHPMYDSSLVIKTAYTYRTTDIVVKKPSLLNANDTIYRLPMYSEGITGFSSFGVSVYNHNNTHMTLGIKKRLISHCTLLEGTPPFLLIVLLTVDQTLQITLWICLTTLCYAVWLIVRAYIQTICSLSKQHRVYTWTTMHWICFIPGVEMMRLLWEISIAHLTHS